MNFPPPKPGGSADPAAVTPTSTSQEHNKTRDRLLAISREIQNLRGPQPIPSSPPPPPMAPDCVRSLVVLFAESAVHHVAVGNFDEGRRAIGEVVRLMPDIRDPGIIAKSLLYIGEALIGLDAPTHAKERLESAIKMLEKLGETRLVARAKISLGRALTALEDPTSLDILMEAKQGLMVLNAAAKSGPSSKIEAAYGRPVSGRPPAK